MEEEAEEARNEKASGVNEPTPACLELGHGDIGNTGSSQV